MPLFICTSCKTVDNTALGAYWHRQDEPLCAACDPDQGDWHECFPRKIATDGMVEANGTSLIYEIAGGLSSLPDFPTVNED